MKTVGDKLTPFAVTGVRPGQPEDAFYTINQERLRLHCKSMTCILGPRIALFQASQSPKLDLEAGASTLQVSKSF